MILDAIVAHKRHEVDERKQRRPLAQLEAALAQHAEPTRPFATALRQHQGVAIIAEIKRKSPSGGELRQGVSAPELAALYAANGAAALSVLTDYHYFGGEDSDLVVARESSGLPALRKDFIIDEYQVYEARGLGADAALLIVRVLSPAELSHLLAVAHRLDMAALVETHSADEVRLALDAGARVVGVNNRDLDTLITDSSLASRLRELVPPECVYVAESGISSPGQMAGLAAAGVDAVLIGESLLRSSDPAAKLRELAAAGHSATVVSGP
jgi:indole-3-glycerol phosphate synthase